RSSAPPGELCDPDLANGLGDRPGGAFTFAQPHADTGGEVDRLTALEVDPAPAAEDDEELIDLGVPHDPLGELPDPDVRRADPPEVQDPGMRVAAYHLARRLSGEGFCEDVRDDDALVVVHGGEPTPPENGDMTVPPKRIRIVGV